jgi:hypothetical protein
MNFMLKKTKKQKPRNPFQNSKFQPIPMVNLYYNLQIVYCLLCSYRRIGETSCFRAEHFMVITDSF